MTLGEMMFTGYDPFEEVREHDLDRHLNGLDHREPEEIEEEAQDAEIKDTKYHGTDDGVSTAGKEI